jgi:acetyl esterase/lipase
LLVKRQYLCRKLFLGLLLCGAATYTAAQNVQPGGQPPAVSYAPVEPGVSYEAVTSLNYSTPAAMIPYGNDLLQFGLLWLPANERRPPAQIVFIHGGCWLDTYDVRHTYALSTALAQAGYAVWSLEYRRTGDNGGGWPWTFEDIKTGIAHVHPAPEFPDIPVIVMGHSAGGHLALLAGAADPTLKGVVGLAAVTDIIEYAQGDNSCQTVVPAFMGGSFENRAEEYHTANPAEKTPHLSTVLLHGSADEIVPAAQAAIEGARTVMVEGAGHFDWVHPGTEAFRTLLSTLQEMLQ